MNAIWSYWLLAIGVFLLYRCIYVMRRRLKQRSTREIEEPFNCDEGFLRCCWQFPSKCRYLLRANENSGASTHGLSAFALMRRGAPIVTEEVDTDVDTYNEEMEILAEGDGERESDEDGEGESEGQGREGGGLERSYEGDGSEEEGEGMEEGQGSSSVSATMLQRPRKARGKSDQRLNSTSEGGGSKGGNGFVSILSFNFSSLFRTTSSSSPTSTSPSSASSSQLLPIFSQDNPMMNHDHPVNPTIVGSSSSSSSQSSPNPNPSPRPSPGSVAEHTKATFSNPRSLSLPSTHNQPNHNHPSSSANTRPSLNTSLGLSLNPSASPRPSPQPRPQLSPQYISSSSPTASSFARSPALSLAGQQEDDVIVNPSTDTAPSGGGKKQTHPLVRCVCVLIISRMLTDLTYPFDRPHILYMYPPRS